MPLLRQDKVQQPVKKRTLTLKKTAAHYENFFKLRHIQARFSKQAQVSKVRPVDENPPMSKESSNRLSSSSIYYQSANNCLNGLVEAATVYEI